MRLCHLAHEGAAGAAACRGLLRLFKSRIGRGFLWLTVGTALGRGLPVAANIIAARFMNTADYGALSLILATAGTFQLLAIFGGSASATRFIALEKDRDKLSAGVTFTALVVVLFIMSSLVMIVLVIIEKSGLSPFVIGLPQRQILLICGGIGIALAALEICYAVFIGLEAHRALILAQMIGGSSIGFGLLIGGSIEGFLGASSGMLLGGMGAVALVCASVKAELNRNGIPITLPRTISDFSPIWSFSVPTTIAAAAWLPATLIAQTLLSRAPSGLIELGWFFAANQCFVALTLLPQILGRATLPVQAAHVGAGSEGVAIRATRLAARMSLAAVCVAGLLLFVLRHRFLGIFGAEFTNQTSVLTVTIASGIVVSQNGPHLSYILARGAAWSTAGLNLCWAVVLVTSSYFLVNHGAFGLAIAYLAAHVTRTLGILWLWSAMSATKRPLTWRNAEIHD